MKRDPKNLQGFTLIEILVAMALVGIFFATIASVVAVTAQRREQAAEITRVSRTAGAILDIMADDIWGSYIYRLEEDGYFEGEENGEFLHLVTTTNSRVPVDDQENGDRRHSASDLTEISYMVRTNPNNSDYKELYRREDYYVDDEPQKGGAFQLLYDRVISIKFSYLKPQEDNADDASAFAGLGDEDWEEKWVTDRTTGLPGVVKIELELYVEVAEAYREREEGLGYTFIRYVSLPSYDPARLVLFEPDPNFTLVREDRGGSVDGDEEEDGEADPEDSGSEGAGGAGEGSDTDGNQDDGESGSSGSGARGGR